MIALAFIAGFLTALIGIVALGVASAGLDTER